MSSQYNNLDINFTKATVYKIVVKGSIDEELSERLLGLQVNIEEKDGKKQITSLIGKIRDQAALSGILNTLWEMHIAVISANILLELEK